MRGQRGGQAGVALVLCDGDHAGFGDCEIAAGDAHVGGDVLVPQDAARDHGEVLGVIGGGAAELFGEEGADLAAGEVHGREDNVVGSLVAELDDVLAEVALDHAVAGLFQRFIQMDFLGGHGLGFDDRAGAFFPQDPEDDLARLFSGAGPVDSCAAGFKFRGEGLEMDIEVIDGFPFALGGGLAGALPILEADFSRSREVSYLRRAVWMSLRWRRSPATRLAAVLNCWENAVAMTRIIAPLNSAKGGRSGPCGRHGWRKEAFNAETQRRGGRKRKLLAGEDSARWSVFIGFF